MHESTKINFIIAVQNDQWSYALSATAHTEKQNDTMLLLDEAQLEPWLDVVKNGPLKCRITLEIILKTYNII